MPRPNFISDKDIKRWSYNLDHDPHVSTAIKSNNNIREICYAGLWLSEELAKIGCPASLVHRIQWTAGGLSFGRDTWEVHQEMLEKYKNDGLIFEEDPDEIKN